MNGPGRHYLQKVGREAYSRREEEGPPYPAGLSSQHDSLSKAQELANSETGRKEKHTGKRELANSETG